MFDKFFHKKCKEEISQLKSKIETLENPKEIDSSEIPNIIKEWEIVIQTQIHFNELLMKLRTATLSVVLSIFGAAGYSILNKEAHSLIIDGVVFHPSAFIISAGLILLFSMFLMDYFYYYKLLIAAVNKGKMFDKPKIQGVNKSWKYFGLTTTISDQFGSGERSKWFVWTFYGIPFVAGILFLAAVIIGITPS